MIWTGFYLGRDEGGRGLRLVQTVNSHRVSQRHYLWNNSSNNIESQMLKSEKNNNVQVDSKPIKKYSLPDDIPKNS